jgi:IclR family acetate operon transcriptional repressor
MPSPNPSPAVKSALRTLDILELFAQQGRPLAAHEISTTLGIPVSSLSYLLSTLVERDYLARDRRHYRLGPSFAYLRRDEPGDAARAAPLVRAMTRELNETAGFFVREGFEIEVVASEVGQQALRYTLEVGQRAPLHAFAAGKALLAALPEKELALYFRGAKRRAYTPATIVAEAELRAALAEVRAAGIARTREEHTPGIAGIARAAIVDGKALGAFSIAVPVSRLTAEVERRAVQLLTRATNLLAGGETDAH